MSQSVRFSHLGLTDWPFSVVPTPRGTSFIADRAELREELRSLISRLSRRDQSTIHLMWAWFGAGKTHALQHLAYLCESGNNNLLPVYTELPKTARGFTDVFQQAATAWESNAFADSYMEVLTRRDSEAQLRSLRRGFGDDTLQALRLLLTGEDREQQIVRRWMQAERLPVSALREVGLNRHVQTAEQAAQVFSTITRIHGLSKDGGIAGTGRVVWIIDEFQRIKDCPKSARDEISTAIHSLINSTPNYLTIILSFSGRPEKRLPAWLTPAIADRTRGERVMILPPLRRDEAETFVKDVFVEFRPCGYHGPLFFPFTDASVSEVLDTIERQSEFKPRRIMQYFNAVLEEADLEIQDGHLKDIGVEFVCKALSGREFEDDGGDES